MKILHELYNEGGVLAPLVVATIHAVALAVVWFLGWLLTPVIDFISRLISQFHDFVMDILANYDED